MDKIEFNLKIEQLKKRVKAGDYATAMSICDDIDWRRVSSVSLLSMVSEVYEKNQDYSEAKEILLLAYEKAPIGKRLLFKLCLLAILEGNIDEAETYYREFYDLAPDDQRQNILRYLILRQKGAPIEQLINSLEAYVRTELDEQYMYELAELYHEAGRSADCVEMCDKIMLMFGIGNYVDKAIQLKTVGEGCPLTEYQRGLVDNRADYVERFNQISQEYNEGSLEGEIVGTAMDEQYGAPVEEVIDIPAGGVIDIAVDEAISMPVDEVIDVPAGEVIDMPVGETIDMPVDETISVSVEEPDDVKIYQPEAQPTTQPAVQPEIISPIADFIANPEPKTEEEPVSKNYTVNIIIERKTPEAGFEAAKNVLRLIHDNTGSSNGVIKIKASRLNMRGVPASAEKLIQKDLIIEEAGDLTFDTVEQIIELIRREPGERVIVLVDNPMQLNKVLNAHPNLTNYFHIDRDDAEPVRTVRPVQTAAQTATQTVKSPVHPAQSPVRPAGQIRQVEDMAESIRIQTPDEVRELPAEPELDMEAFAQECVRYAEEIDCSISGKSMLALYERIEIMEEDGVPLTKTTAADLIEEAADLAEKKGLGSLFVKKYDKDDKLILREEHFLP